MRTAKWVLALLVLAVVGAFLHYTLPQTDIVRIVGVENRRIDFGENSIFWAGPDVGTAAAVSRDVRFIEGVRDGGRPSVYRNEDTGWGWPPYFKLDSSNLQAEARDLVSTGAVPQWVALTHYGWRSEVLSIFPNAVAVRPVAGPDATIVPWFNIVLLTLLAAVLWALGVRVMRFRRNRIDPMLDDAGDRMAERRRGVRAWLDGRRGGPRG